MSSSSTRTPRNTSSPAPRMPRSTRCPPASPPGPSMDQPPRPPGRDAGPRTRAEHVAERLREMIVGGELEPGARLRQADVAEWFDVSTTPVREAFTALAREGFVRQSAHRLVEVFRP